MGKIKAGNEISERIIQLMSINNISLYMLAKNTGIFTSTIDNSLKKVNSWASARNLKLIADALKVDINYLITGKTDTIMEFTSENEIIKKQRKEINELKKQNEECKKVISEIRKNINRKINESA